MNYEEYLNIFNKLKTSTYNIETLNELKNTPINTNIQEMLIPKYIELIKYKFSESIKKIKVDLYSIFDDVNYLDLILVNFKKEINYLLEMINLNILTTDKKIELIKLIKDETNHTYDILLKKANNVDPKGNMTLTINNNKIKWRDNNEL